MDGPVLFLAAAPQHATPDMHQSLPPVPLPCTTSSYRYMMVSSNMQPTKT